MLRISARYKRASHWSSLISIVAGAAASSAARVDLPAAILPQMRNSVGLTLSTSLSQERRVVGNATPTRLFFCRVLRRRGFGCLDLLVFSVRLRVARLADDLHLNLIADLWHVLAQAEVGTLERRLGIKADRRQIAPRVRADL